MAVFQGFDRLPDGHAGHPETCVCQLHLRGVWAGYDPTQGTLMLPDSPTGRAARERIERDFRVRFDEELTPLLWQAARRDHERIERLDQERRWRRGEATAAERLLMRYRTGAALGRWPA